MYGQRYEVNETINDSTAGSIGQEQHSISSLSGTENNSSRYQTLRFCLSAIPTCR